MTQQQINQIDDLNMIRGKLGTRATLLLNSFMDARTNFPSVQLAHKAVDLLNQLWAKHEKQIKKAKKNAYVLLPSGFPS